MSPQIDLETVRILSGTIFMPIMPRTQYAQLGDHGMYIMFHLHIFCSFLLVFVDCRRKLGSLRCHHHQPNWTNRKLLDLPQHSVSSLVWIAQSLVFSVVFCEPLFVFFPFLPIVLSVLIQLTASDHRLTFLPIVLSVLLQLASSDHRLTFYPLYYLSFFSLLLLTTVWLFTHCIICPSSACCFWAPFDFCTHCIICHSSAYCFWPPFDFLPIVSSVLLQLAASDHRLTFLPIVLSFLLQLAASDHRLTFLPIVLSFLLQLAASDQRLTFLPIVLSVLLQLAASDHRLTFLLIVLSVILQLTASD